VDPRTGRAAEVVWRTVSVAAATCVDANTAATAAIVLGHEAPSWLAAQGLPARLVSASGAVHTVAGWPVPQLRVA
jgi:thiamine biosynthesis lipoprotein